LREARGRGDHCPVEGGNGNEEKVAVQEGDEEEGDGGDSEEDDRGDPDVRGEGV